MLHTGRKHLSSFLFLITLSLALASCSEPPAQVTKISGETMGSSYHISWVGAEVSPSEVHELVEQRLQHLINVFSTYEAASELSQLNRRSEQLVQQGADNWIAVSPELMSVLLDAEHVNRFSLGRLDITVGPLVNLWGFGPEPHDKVPAQSDIDERLTMVGMKHLHLRPETNEIMMDQPLYLDLSAIAKGWAVDDIGLMLEAMDIHNYLVEIGGELRVRGKKTDGDWKVAIERPVMQAGQSVQKIVVPGDMAVATSGDYRNYFEQDGQRYSHTIDPKTGAPIRHALASVTVILPTCSLADAWATAINVAGPEVGMILAEANDLPVYMLIRDGDGYREEISSAYIRMYGEETP